MRPINTNDSDGPGTSTPPQRQRAEQEVAASAVNFHPSVDVLVVASDDLAWDSRSRMVWWSPSGGPHGREQPQGAPTCSGDEFGDSRSVPPGRAAAVRPGGGRCGATRRDPDRAARKLIVQATPGRLQSGPMP